MNGFNELLTLVLKYWEAIFSGIGTYILELCIAGVIGLLSWILRRPLGQLLIVPSQCLWHELRYLRRLIKNHNLSIWKQRYVTLRAVKARRVDESSDAKPLLNLLQNYINHNQQVIVLGVPGAGKTATLEALTYRMARIAYWKRAAVCIAFFSLVALLTGFHSYWWGLLILGIGLFDFVFRRWPLSMLIELRRYQGDVENFLKNTIAVQVGSNILSEKFRSYVEHGRLVCFIDGINEVPAEAYDGALEGWRQHFKQAHYFAHTPTVITSRIGDDPANRLGLEETLQVLDLDDEGVQAFLRAYGSQDVTSDFAALERHDMLGEEGLGRNPYWLKMMLESGLYTRNRGVLFESFTRKLIQRELEKGKVRPNPSEVPLDDELEALGYIAYLMSDVGQVGFSLDQAEEELADWLDSKKLGWKPGQVLQEAEAATLMQVSSWKNRAEFTHQLVQEFFTAYHLRLHRDEPLKRLKDTRWWETLLILAGLLETHTLEDGQNVGRHEDHCQLVRDTLADARDEPRVFLAVAMLRSVDKVDQELEHQVTAALVKSLHQRLTQEHKQAVKRLTEIVGDEVVEAVGELLQTTDQIVKERAIEILGEIKRKKAAEVLTGSLGNQEIGDQAAAALVSIGEPAVEPLIAALKDEHEGVRFGAAKALRRLGEPAVEPLIAALKDEHKEVRSVATEVLGGLGDARAVEPLIAALRDEDVWVRFRATEALGRLGDPAVEPLIAALKDEHKMVRSNAAWALGRLEDARAMEPLIAALKDEYETVVSAATEAIERMRAHTRTTWRT